MDIGSQSSFFATETVVGAFGKLDIVLLSFLDAPDFVHGCKCRYFHSGNDTRQRSGKEDKNKIEKHVKSVFD